MRRLSQWTDFNGAQFDQDWFTYSFVPNSPNVTGGVSGTLAPGASAIATVNIEQDSAFQAEYFTASAANNASDVGFGETANLTIQITDTAAGRNLFNEPVPISLIAGSGQFPYVLPVPRRFMPRGSIITTITNYDTAITFKNIQFNMIGRKIFMPSPSYAFPRFRSWQDPETGRILSEDYFGYHFGFGSIAAAATPLQNSQLIEADSDFETRVLSACQNTALNTGASGIVQDENQLNILDGGTQRNLMNVPIIGSALAGFKGTPMILPVPRIFLARTSVVVTLSNNSAGTTVAQTDVLFAGRKIFEYGRE
jgi:hypothetical protein